MKSFLCLIGLLATSTSLAAKLTISNQTGGRARVAELFNVCQGNLIDLEKPIFLEDSQSVSFEIPTVMHHYKICAQGFCSVTAIQIKENIPYELIMQLSPGGIIEGKSSPEHWGGPTNPCPEL